MFIFAAVCGIFGTLHLTQGSPAHKQKCQGHHREANPPPLPRMLHSLELSLRAHKLLWKIHQKSVHMVGKILQKKTQWHWGHKQHSEFKEAKAQLTSVALLTHYDPDKEIILECDTSSYGIGAVLSHRMENGERPITFASRSLSAAEKGYVHLHKEALAVIFGVKKFHKYFYGRKFKIRSGHKPVQHVFDSSRAIPQLASARLQRWALILSAYDYTIDYRPGQKHANADFLSRLPLSKGASETRQPQEVILLMDTLNMTPTTAKDISRWTKTPYLHLSDAGS